MSASAIDISVQEMLTGKEIDRGRPYLEMSELTPMESPFIEKAALENRLAIRHVLESNGFLAYPFEFGIIIKAMCTKKFFIILANQRAMERCIAICKAAK